MSIQKPALVVRRTDLPSAEGLCVIPIPPNFFLLETELRSRVGENSCEEDPSVQQIIPYIVVTNEDNEIFTYSRGGAGGEDKLKSKLSIGLGGHIDGLAPEGMFNYEWFTKEAKRELAEEVGIMSDVNLDYLGLLFDRVAEKEENGKTYVGQVHVGLMATVRVSRSEVTKLEQGVIDNGQWMSVHDLQVPEVFNRLENWSQASLSHILQHISNGDVV
jgi:predicted NUDIX family phosphoesterase